MSYNGLNRRVHPGVCSIFISLMLKRYYQKVQNLLKILSATESALSLLWFCIKFSCMIHKIKCTVCVGYICTESSAEPLCRPGPRPPSLQNKLLFKVLQLFQAPRRESVGMIRGRSSTDLGFILCTSWINMARRWKYKPSVHACPHTRV